MSEQLDPEIQHQSHASSPRADALRRLSRSPHPYHRLQFELAHGSERLSPNGPAFQTRLSSVENTDEERKDGIKVDVRGYKGSANSDSGTEADDEHFLKGLPAPKLKLHKGLRGAEGSPSSSPSPLLSPAILDEEGHKRLRSSRPLSPLNEDDLRKVAEKYRQRRRVEVIRRTTELGILAFVGGILCLDPGVRRLVYMWKRELACQCLVISTLIAVYPLRLLRNINPSRPWTRPFDIAVPASFDPAPLLYPPIIATLVSLVLSRDRPGSFLPTLILGIACLPRNLIPSTGGLDGSNTAQWFLSSLPLLVARPANTSGLIQEAISSNPSLKPEIVLLIPPLHQTLCATLNSLTTTSLLPAELQLLSMSLINLLFLAKSPQAVILKSLLWGGGIGVLVTCAKVLKWGVVLARIPKWRFRRAEPLLKSSARKVLDSKHPFTLRSSVFARNPVVTDSSENSDLELAPPTPNLKLNTKIAVHVGNDENGSVSAVEPKSNTNGATSIAGMAESYRRNRRHTLPSLRMLSPIKSAEKTPSGRKKISASSSLQSFFHLTQAQATMRKWLYAGYVYFCLLIIILVGIREYVGRYALSGDEPVGWALGYLFGDVPWFRMKVVSFGLQRWIRLPPRSGLEHQESCYKGWVEHLRHASFGEANTRLILCAYWLAVIIVGLAVVLRLSSIYEVDTRRKVFHFMMVAMLLPATYVDPTFAALALSLMLAIFLLLDLFRASQLPPLSKSLAYFLTPYVDGRDLKGPVVISHIFLLIGCAIPLWLSLASLPRIGTDALAGWEVPSREVSMVSGVICVGMGDAAASLIGRRYGRRKWLWGGGKSIEGSVAFATAVGLALVLAKAWLRIGGWVANNEDSWFMTVRKAGVAAWVASLTEAVLTGGNDNVVVPVVLWLCTKGLDI